MSSRSLLVALVLAGCEQPAAPPRSEVPAWALERAEAARALPPKVVEPASPPRAPEPPLVEDLDELAPRGPADGPLPAMAPAWDDARVGDTVSLRFKLEKVTGHVRAEVIEVGPIVTVAYEVTQSSFPAALVFLVEVDRQRALPRGVTLDAPSRGAGSVVVKGKRVHCSKVKVPFLGLERHLDEGTGCRAAAMPWALMDGWLQGKGGDWELQVESSARGSGSMPARVDAPVLLATSAWAYKKDPDPEGLHVSSHRRYSIRGSIVDSSLRYPVNGNEHFLARLVSARPLGELVTSVILDVDAAIMGRNLRGGAAVTDEVLEVNDRKVFVHTQRGTWAPAEAPLDYVVSTAADPLSQDLDTLIWSLRVAPLRNGSPSEPGARDVLSWGLGAPPPPPLVPRGKPRAP